MGTYGGFAVVIVTLFSYIGIGAIGFIIFKLCKIYSHKRDLKIEQGKVKQFYFKKLTKQQIALLELLNYDEIVDRKEVDSLTLQLQELILNYKKINVLSEIKEIENKQKNRKEGLADD